MGDVHNLQVIIARSPVLARLNSSLQYSTVNGAQIINVIEETKNKRKLSTVGHLTEVEKTEREEERKRRIKKSSKQLIDIYG